MAEPEDVAARYAQQVRVRFTQELIAYLRIALDAKQAESAQCAVQLQAAIESLNPPFAANALPATDTVEAAWWRELRDWVRCSRDAAERSGGTALLSSRYSAFSDMLEMMDAFDGKDSSVLSKGKDVAAPYHLPGDLAVLWRDVAAQLDQALHSGDPAVVKRACDRYNAALLAQDGPVPAPHP